MSTLEDIEAFRRTPAAIEFARAWISERKNELPSCDHLINLTIWQKSHPHQALGIILNLVDEADGDEEVSEMIAMGPATEIVEATDDTFSPQLREAISTYPKFALFTQWLREHSQDSRWTRLKAG